MGQEADPEIVAMFGLYDDAQLQQLVAELGASLAATSERPNLPWTFRVVDDPIVNAFALPGGFIYVSRGILAHFDSEAQLVSVLGHEIGHVTARHSASQITKQQLAQVGLGVGVILAPDLADFAGLASAGLGLLFLKHSRDDERQADALGFRYMTRADYDPREMPGVFMMLGRVTAAAGGRGAPAWLSTHPDPGDRRQRIDALIVRSGRDLSGTTVRRREYLRRLDGLVFGQNPREGFFRDQLFLHPDLRFQISFPVRWQTVNQKQAVMGQSPNEDAVMQVTLSEAGSPAVAAREFLAQEGVTGGSIRSGSIHGFSTATAGFTARSDEVLLRGLVTFVEYEGNVYRLLAFTRSDRWRLYEQAVRQAFESFDRLTDQTVLSVQPMRVRIVTLDSAMTLEQFQQRYPSSISLEALEIINQVEPGMRMDAGRLVKRVMGTGIPGNR